MPTHRKEGKVNFSKFLINELQTINNNMIKMNAIFLIKLHFYHQKDIDNQQQQFSNIIFIKDYDIQQDIYSVLAFTDLLITDYSSIFFDYLFTQKPILFFPFDKKDYVTTDRELYFEYDNIIPGPQVLNWKEMYSVIETIFHGKDDYINKRKEIHDKFNKYQDGKNCERLTNYIKNL